jgi:2-succinyl-5-enolpyruvyl-6-hydroxy-3-cyclohexene-1-carboxylate synthase
MTRAAPDSLATPSREREGRRNSIEHARALFALFASGGVRRAVVSPGARSFPLALAAGERLEAHVVVDERSAAFFALGLARTSREPVVFLCTSGSAGAHALPALLEARYGGAPLVVVTANRPRELWDCGALQTVDQHFFGEHAARSELGAELPAGALATRVAQLLDVARTPGPVHVDVPLREPLWDPGWTVEPPIGRMPDAEERSPRLRALPAIARADAAPSRRQIADLAAACAGRRGAIVCGPVPPLSPAPAAIAELAAALRWPLIAEPASQLASCTSAAAFLRDAPAALAPETVLAFGAAPTARSVGEWLARTARGRVILCDAHGRFHDPHHLAASLVVADPALVAASLAAAAPEPAPPAWLETWARADRAARRVLDDAASSGFWEGAVARAAIDAAVPGAIVHLGNSSPIRDAALFAAPAGRRVLASRGTSGIDGGIATVLGEAIAASSPAVALLGDVAFAHDLGSLFHVPRADVALVVVDNGGGGIFRTLPLAAAGEAFARYCLAPVPVDVAAVCAAAGVAFHAARDAAELRRAVAEERGLRVVHAVVDGAESARIRSRAVDAAARAAREEIGA